MIRLDLLGEHSLWRARWPGSTNFTATSDSGTGILITDGTATNAGISDVF
ncbi:MAG: hypothetical protein WA813_24530 [Beijerinckiaceae bacterium]